MARTLLLFGLIREHVGAAAIDVPDQIQTGRELLEWLADEWPDIASLLPSCRLAVNQNYLRDLDAPLGDGEWAIIPPVAGGTASVRVTTEPIDAAAALARVSDPAAGANVVFTGTVRNHHEGRAVAYIEYEAYVPMAESVLADIAARAQQTFGLSRIELIHRYGKLDIGEASVCVAVSAPHRGEAFAAVAWIMNEIKADVPIFKHEYYADGTSAWVRCHHHHMTDTGASA